MNCLCVCVSQKSLFPYSKELVVSMFPVTFRIQRIWSFPCFQTHSVFKEFGRFFCLETHSYSRDLVFPLVSRHFPYSKMSRNSKTTKSFEIMIFQGILLFLLFPDTFRIQGILSFLLFLDTFGKGWKIRKLEGWKVGRSEG